MAAALIANVASGASGQNDTTTTGSIDTTGANFLLAFLSSTSLVTETTPTDSKSNTWFRLATLTQATNNMRLSIWISVPTSVGSGHTFTHAITNGVPSIAVLAFSGVHSPLGSDSDSAVESHGTGTVTLPQQTGVVVTAVTIGAPRTVAVDSDFTIADTVAHSAGEHFGLVSAYKFSETGTETPTFSWTGGGTTSAVSLRWTLAEDGTASGGASAYVFVG